MSISKQYLEEVLGIRITARHKEECETWNPFLQPIIHREIHGEKVYVN